MSTAFLPLMMFAPVLVYAGSSDLRRMRIPNWTSLVAIAIFLVAMPLFGWSDSGWRLLAAATVFAVGLGLWALHMFGAGDVKLLSASLLLVPTTELHLFSQVFAVSMLLGLGAVTGLRASGALRHTGWVSMRAAGHFPMGVSIALAGVTLPVVSGLL